jgi:hypothetical protein
MGPHVSTLVRRDHDDIDRAFSVLIDPATPPRELVEMLDVVKLATCVHAAAEARILQLLVARTPSLRVISMIANQTRAEHVTISNALDALASLRPASLAWYEHAIELRAVNLDHAVRSEQLRWTLRDHVPADLPELLASEYATQRMLVLSTSAPDIVARRRDALISAA